MKRRILNLSLQVLGPKEAFDASPAEAVARREVPARFQYLTYVSESLARRHASRKPGYDPEKGMPEQRIGFAWMFTVEQRGLRKRAR